MIKKYILELNRKLGKLKNFVQSIGIAAEKICIHSPPQGEKCKRLENTCFE